MCVNEWHNGRLQRCRCVDADALALLLHQSRGGFALLKSTWLCLQTVATNQANSEQATNDYASTPACFAMRQLCAVHLGRDCTGGEALLARHELPANHSFSWPLVE